MARSSSLIFVSHRLQPVAAALLVLAALQLAHAAAHRPATSTAVRGQIAWDRS